MSTSPVSFPVSSAVTFPAATPVATATPSVSFAIPDARLAFFGSKDEYLAFKSAWKALARSRASLPPSFYAAHAILTGRDLYKTFSASQRPHDAGQPFRSLHVALKHLCCLKRTWQYEFRPGTPGEARVKALHENILSAIGVVESLKLNGAATREAIVTGAGSFPHVVVPSEAVEA